MFKRRLSRHVQFIHHGKANTSMPTIVLCRPLHASGMALLEARHDVAIRTLNRPSPKDLAEAMPGAPSMWLPYVQVDDIVAATAKAKSLGATVVQDVMEVMGEGSLSVIIDPTGATLGLWQQKAK